jgi:hypothetical protein
VPYRIRDQADFRSKRAYSHHNPVRAHLVDLPEQNPGRWPGLVSRRTFGAVDQSDDLTPTLGIALDCCIRPPSFRISRASISAYGASPGLLDPGTRTRASLGHPGFVVH